MSVAVRLGRPPRSSAWHSTPCGGQRALEMAVSLVLCGASLVLLGASQLAREHTAAGLSVYRETGDLAVAG